MNKVLGIGLIGLGAYGLIKLLRMKNVGDSISTNLVNPPINKVTLQGISFPTEVAIYNPTKDSVKITTCCNTVHQRQTSFAVKLGE